MSFEVKIPLFEGPFDLLLFFIRRDELDIHDIPISKITNDFLEYIHRLEQMNIEVASEFILVAATLMRIKAKMLLPRPELDEEGNEIDPREDLVRHLLEYKKYKEVVSILEQWEESMLQKEKRGNVGKELRQIAESEDLEIELQDVDLYKILKTYQRILQRAEDAAKKETTHQVIPFPYNLEEQKSYILSQLYLTKDVSFEKLLQQDFNRVALIFNFLAILELLASEQISIRVGEGFNNFWISSKQTPQNPVLQSV